MEQTLKALQDLQMKAYKKGIRSFDITARWFEDGESGLRVTIFLTGDDTDEDYNTIMFYKPSRFKLAEIAGFIGEDPNQYVQA